MDLFFNLINILCISIEFIVIYNIFRILYITVNKFVNSFFKKLIMLNFIIYLINNNLLILKEFYVDIGLTNLEIISYIFFGILSYIIYDVLMIKIVGDLFDFIWENSDWILKDNSNGLHNYEYLHSLNTFLDDWSIYDDGLVNKIRVNNFVGDWIWSNLKSDWPYQEEYRECFRFLKGIPMRVHTMAYEDEYDPVGRYPNMYLVYVEGGSFLEAKWPDMDYTFKGYHLKLSESIWGYESLFYNDYDYYNPYFIFHSTCYPISLDLAPIELPFGCNRFYAWGCWIFEYPEERDFMWFFPEWRFLAIVRFIDKTDSFSFLRVPSLFIMERALDYIKDPYLFMESFINLFYKGRIYYISLIICLLLSFYYLILKCYWNSKLDFVLNKLYIQLFNQGVSNSINDSFICRLLNKDFIYKSNVGYNLYNKNYTIQSRSEDTSLGESIGNACGEESNLINSFNWSYRLFILCISQIFIGFIGLSDKNYGLTITVLYLKPFHLLDSLGVRLALLVEKFSLSLLHVYFMYYMIIIIVCVIILELSIRLNKGKGKSREVFLYKGFWLLKK